MRAAPGIAQVARQPLDTAYWIRLAFVAATFAGAAAWATYVWAIAGSVAVDAHAYYAAPLDALYGGGQEGARDLYVYSPAFAQLTAPLRSLGASGFVTAWQSIEAGALVVLAGPWSGPLLFVQPFAAEVAAGNVHLVMGLAIVLGFRWPATWAFVLLTKVTPGIGLVWFAVRREWRQLAIALGATAAVAAVSFALNAGLWASWLSMLAGQAPPADRFELVSAPLIVRLPAAAAIVAWGARTDRRWTVLVAAFLALPVTWPNGAAMLAGLFALRGPSTRSASAA